MLTTSSPGHTAKSDTARRSTVDGQTGTGSRVRVAVDLGDEMSLGGEKDSNRDNGVTVVNNNNTSSRGSGIDTNSGKTIDSSRGSVTVTSTSNGNAADSTRRCKPSGGEACKTPPPNGPSASVKPNRTRRRVGRLNRKHGRHVRLLPLQMVR